MLLKLKSSVLSTPTALDVREAQLSDENTEEYLVQCRWYCV